MGKTAVIGVIFWGAIVSGIMVWKIFGAGWGILAAMTMAGFLCLKASKALNRTTTA